MKWRRNVHNETAGQIEDLAYPPVGGGYSRILLGILLPLAIVGFAARTWWTEHAMWFSTRVGQSEPVEGATAKALAVVYLSAALFSHFRWVWGPSRFWRVYEIGTVFSLLVFLGGIGAAIWFAFV